LLLAATNPAIRSVDNAIESFILILLVGHCCFIGVKLPSECFVAHASSADGIALPIALWGTTAARFGEHPQALQ
jgi:hypothetical protein